MTAVALDALRSQRKLLQQQQQKAEQVQELMEIAKRCAAHIRQPVSAVDHGDILYEWWG